MATAKLGKLIVTCERPGLIRGGVRNPASATYPANKFTPAQLAELLAEPAITVTYVTDAVALTADNFADVLWFEAEDKVETAAKPAAKTTAKSGA